MPRLVVFENVTLDGYFTDDKGDMSWAHRGSDDPEFARFVAGNASSGGRLIFGRKTYEMMVAFWPTQMAAQMMPEVARGMNAMPKLVFSRTLRESPWNNTTIRRDDLVATVRQLKESAGPDMAILGSGSLVAQLAHENLIDELQLVFNPLALGGGRTLFEGMKGQLPMRLNSSRVFSNGKIFATYIADA